METHLGESAAPQQAQPSETTLWIFAIVVVTLAYAGLAGTLPLATLDLRFFPDDTYYTLSIARSMAEGLGPTTEGTILTSGFQPLLALLMQPVFWLGGSDEAAMRATACLSALAGAGACTMLGLIARDATQSTGAGLVTMGLSALSPTLFHNALNGLETTLAAFLILALVRAALRLDANAPLGRVMAIGALAGLTLWARIDAAFPILILGAIGLGRVGPWRTLIIAAVALAVYAPWGGYCLWIDGTPLPASGSAVREIVKINPDIGFTPTIVAMIGLSTIPTMIADLPRQPAALAVLLHLPLVWILVTAARTRRMDAAAVLAATALIALAFYVLVLPAHWFFHRYLHLAGMAAILCTVLTLHPLMTSRVTRLTLTAMAAALATLHASTLVGHATRGWAGETTLRLGYGYGTMARDLLPSLPPGSTLTAMQSGALGYFAQDDIRVVNLDGVVNLRASHAMKDHALDSYLAEIGATHFGDWPLNFQWLHSRSGSDLPPMTSIAVFPEHGQPNWPFRIARLDWPD